MVHAPIYMDEESDLNMVHAPVDIKKALNNPKAIGAVDDEWKKLDKKFAFDYASVQPKQKVIANAKAKFDMKRVLQRQLPRMRQSSEMD